MRLFCAAEVKMKEKAVLNGNQTSKLATIFCPSRTFTFEKYDGRLCQRFVILFSQNFLDNNDMLCMDWICEE
jgi:hypothetical protein